MKVNIFIYGIPALLFSACGVMEAPIPANLVNVNPSTYIVHDREQTSVIRAFEDGTRTVVQFADFDGSVPFLYNENGEPIEYQRAGSYAMLPAVYDKVVIRQRQRLSMISHPSIPSLAIYYPPLFGNMTATSKSSEQRNSLKPLAILEQPKPESKARIVSKPISATDPMNPETEVAPVIVRPLKRKP